MLHDDSVDRRVTQQLPQLGPAVVQPTGYLGHHLVQQDPALSRVGPKAVGLVLQMWFLFGAADPGVANSLANRRIWIGQDVDDVADLFGLEFWRKCAGVVVAPCRHAVHAVLGRSLGQAYVIATNHCYLLLLILPT